MAARLPSFNLQQVQEQTRQAGFLHDNIHLEKNLSRWLHIEWMVSRVCKPQLTEREQLIQNFTIPILSSCKSIKDAIMALLSSTELNVYFGHTENIEGSLRAPVQPSKIYLMVLYESDQSISKNAHNKEQLCPNHPA